MDATPRDAYAALTSDPSARLVDVRTRAEWTFVGLPMMGHDAADPVLIEWQRFPDMQVAADFAAELTAVCADKEAPLYFLCRSGARSLAAAKVMAGEGYTNCHNISGGFEGPPDAEGHRGRVAGWKADSLPWRQS